jgi:ATP-dependent Lhr-like helicase
MRKEIEPVSATDFMKFLLTWQQVTAPVKPRGREGVLQVIRQLQGLELPATAWEQHVLPARIEAYDPADLEHLCLGGVVAWGRLRSDMPATEEHENGGRRRRNRRAPGRSAPLAFLLREDRDYFLDADGAPSEELPGLSAAARQVAGYLKGHGASFLSDIARRSGLLKAKAEESLWELVARGIATGDGIAGLRVLLTPEKKRLGPRSRLRLVSGGQASARAMPLGRWSLWRDDGGGNAIDAEAKLEHRARQLLLRYGIMFRELLARELCAPSWRHLLQIYRRLEARGEIRGGRFVNGFAGEQFALPEAVDRLRAQRRLQESHEPVVISAADPLNLVGILSAGSRLSPYSNQSIAYADGVALETGPLGALLGHLHKRRETAAP